MQNNFDDIRPYLSSEIQVVFRQLLGNEEVLAGASAVMPIALIDDLSGEVYVSDAREPQKDKEDRDNILRYR